ncbi:MAG: cell division protein FtsQ/DivIB [Thermoanaerobaculia bacterium]
MSRELPGADARVLPFRRPASAVRVRRRNPWLAIGRHFAQALVMVGGPTAVALWLFTSPTFALGAVEFGPHPHVSDAWVNEALAPLVGKNLFRLELPDVRARIAEHPWVDRVTVEKRLPNRIVLDVVERSPAALFHDGATLSYLDGKGRVIAPYDPEHGPGDLLLISKASRFETDPAEAFALSHELEVAGPPELFQSLSEIELLGGGDFRIHTSLWPFPLLVRAGTLAARLESVRTLLPELERRYGGVAFIDLRFDRRIVFQPAPRERTGEWPKQNSTS